MITNMDARNKITFEICIFFRSVVKNTSRSVSRGSSVRPSTSGEIFILVANVESVLSFLREVGGGS